MTYLSDRSRKNKNKILYGSLGFLFLLVIIFWPFVKKHSFGLLEPLVIQTSKATQSFVFFPEFFSTYITSHKTLADRQKKLEIEIERLENELADKNALLSEYLLTDTGTSTIASRTLKNNPIILHPLMQDVTRIYSTILLSKGFKDGITIGDTIYVRGNQSVCTIKEVYNSSSLCLLYTASGVTTEGVTSSSSLVLTLTGRGGHFLANVVRESPVSVGEKVYLRSNPKMILGTITSISNNNQDTSWHVFIDGAYNPVTTSIFYAQPK